MTSSHYLISTFEMTSSLDLSLDLLRCINFTNYVELLLTLVISHELLEWQLLILAQVSGIALV